MDYVVIERIVFDALVSQIADCAHTVEKFMKMITPRSLDDWVDNNVAWLHAPAWNTVFADHALVR